MNDERDAAGVEPPVAARAFYLCTEGFGELAVDGGDVNAGLLEQAPFEDAAFTAALILSLPKGAAPPGENLELSRPRAIKLRRRFGFEAFERGGDGVAQASEPGGGDRAFVRESQVVGHWPEDMSFASLLGEGQGKAQEATRPCAGPANPLVQVCGYCPRLPQGFSEDDRCRDPQR